MPPVTTITIQILSLSRPLSFAQVGDVLVMKSTGYCYFPGCDSCSFTIPGAEYFTVSN